MISIKTVILPTFKVAGTYALTNYQENRRNNIFRVPYFRKMKFSKY